MAVSFLAGPDETFTVCRKSEGSSSQSCGSTSTLGEPPERSSPANATPPEEVPHIFSVAGGEEEGGGGARKVKKRRRRGGGPVLALLLVLH